jgi:hypothetical protein
VSAKMMEQVKTIGRALAVSWPTPVWRLDRLLGNMWRLRVAVGLDGRRWGQRSPDPVYNEWLTGMPDNWLEAEKLRIAGQRARAQKSPVTFHIWLRAEGNGVRDTWRNLRRQNHTGWMLHLVHPDRASVMGARFRWVGCRQVRHHLTGPSPQGEASAWHVFLEPGDQLALRALERVAQAIGDAKECVLVYGDHDEWQPDTGRRLNPTLKPDWSPENLLSRPYPGRSLFAADPLLPQVWHGSSGWAWAAEAALAARTSGLAVLRMERVLLHVRPESVGGDAEYNALLAAMGEGPDHRPLARRRRVSVWIPAWDTPQRLARTLASLAPHCESLDRILVATPAQPMEPSQNVIADKVEWVSGDWAAFLERTDADAVLILEAGCVLPGAGGVDRLCWYLEQDHVAGVAPLIVTAAGTVMAVGRAFGLDSLVGNWFVHQPLGAAHSFCASEDVRNVSVLPTEAGMYRVDFLRACADALGSYASAFALHSSLGLAAWRRGWRMVCDPQVQFTLAGDGDEPVLRESSELGRLAGALVESGMRQDPAMHDGWWMENGVVRLRTVPEPAPREKLQRQICAFADVLRRVGPVPVRDRDAMAQFLQTIGLPVTIPAPDPVAAATSAAAAAEHIIGCLLVPGMAQRFPCALSGGIEGPFGQWLLAQDDLNDRARAWCRCVFDEAPGETIRHLYAWREDVRLMYPLGLTIAGQYRFAEWLFHFAHTLEGVERYHVWWHLIESDEHPDRGWQEAYRMHPAWQRAVPPGRNRASPPVDVIISWVKEQYGEFADGVDVRTATGSQEISGGVNLLGHFMFESGLKHSVRECLRALRRVPKAVACCDVLAASVRSGPGRRGEYLDLNVHDTSILLLSPLTSAANWYARAQLARHPDEYVVGCWYTELSGLTSEQVRYARDYDELWAPSRFIEQALAAHVECPVHYMPSSHSLPEPAVVDLVEWGCPEDAFTFCFTFDMCSCMERKNPLGLIRAFRDAFGGDAEVALLIKTARTHLFPADAAALRAAVAETPNCYLCEDLLPLAQALGIMQAADAYVSLHHAEGLGLTMAEAMMMRKPVVATAYSGNLDFMTEANSFLVPWQPVAITRDDIPYPQGSCWAEPDHDAAVQALRQVVGDPALAAARAEQGWRDAMHHFSVEHYAQRLNERLCAIQGVSAVN